MPTLAAGSPEPAHCRDAPAGCSLCAGPPVHRLAHRYSPGLAANGFTLLELLVVVAIVAIASAGVALTLRDRTASHLERDAQRLAAVLESGRAQSRMQGTPILWRATADGFVLEGLYPPVPSQPWLHADTFVGAVLRPAGASNAASGAMLTLGPAPILEAQAVVLAARSQPTTRVQLASDGLRPFAIVPLGTPLGQAAP